MYKVIVAATKGRPFKVVNMGTLKKVAQIAQQIGFNVVWDDPDKSWNNFTITTPGGMKFGISAWRYKDYISIREDKLNEGYWNNRRIRSLEDARDVFQDIMDFENEEGDYAPFEDELEDDVDTSDLPYNDTDVSAADEITSAEISADEQKAILRCFRLASQEVLDTYNDHDTDENGTYYSLFVVVCGNTNPVYIGELGSYLDELEDKFGIGYDSDENEEDGFYGRTYRFYHFVD